MFQTGFYDLENRVIKLDQRDQLLKLNKLIDWSIFKEPLETLRKSARKSAAGRKPFDSLLMFKGLLLQHFYNLSDEELEFQIRDRLTFSRFLGLLNGRRVPDANTFWDFRESLIKHDLLKTLFDLFEEHISTMGFEAKKGQIVDASFVEAPKQRNTREQNETIKAGLIPEEFTKNKSVERQKDTNARWTKKNQEDHYGYKNHVTVDVKHKIIRDFSCTDASVHDSQALYDILVDMPNKRVFADCAYRSQEIEELLYASGYISRIQERAYKNSPLTEKQIESNKIKSKIRARVEHVFGYIKTNLNSDFVRTIGKARATAKVTLTNLVYNINRFCFLSRQGKFA
jgi:transposase, IS5 family